MKRFGSSEDLYSYGDKGVVKDWAKKEDSGSQRSSSSLHKKTSYYRPSESGRNVLSSSTSRFDRLEDERESSKLVTKRPEYDFESYGRRKTYDRYRDVNERGVLPLSPSCTYGMDQMYRSESFSGSPREDFPKGFRSERDRHRPKREGIATSWKRAGGDKDCDNVRRSKSLKGLTDAESPGWSKDSAGSERSKSVEGKKYEDMPVESGGGPSSEREEGELEPDPQPRVSLTESAVKDKAALGSKSARKDVEYGSNNDLVEIASLLSVEKEDASKMCEEQGECELLFKDDAKDGTNKSNDLSDFQDTSSQKGGVSRDENDKNDENRCDNNVSVDGLEGSEDADSTSGDKFYLQEQGEERGVNFEIMAGSELPSTEKTTPSVKGKGKSVALMPTDNVHFTETNLEADYEQWGIAISRDVEMEAPITRGFQFLSTDPVKKPEEINETTHNKPRDDKLALELSLSLPNVLLPIGYQDQGQAPGSPSHARSVQSFGSSFRTNSDGFTASMSFSGSQQFTHNLSCSLTHNALDFEKSVKSKPLFQGVDWQALASEENKNKKIPPHHESQLSRLNSTGQAAVQNSRVIGSSSKLPISLERQLSFNKHLSRAQSFGSYENGIEHSRQLMTDKDSEILHMRSGPDERDPAMVVGPDFAESLVTRIVSEPLHTMARRFSDLTGKQKTCVKEFVLEIISNTNKQWQLSALQNALHKRSDVTLDVLLNANRTQLELMVALKTGLREFLLQKYDITSSELAEIFLNMRCRNLNCRSVLPVDECDCKICAQRVDFCRDCMCLVCSKFDMASNTCSWVGCDVCLHWCHADCGLRESHIRNGQSAKGPRGATEMQFYCVACGHPSEMFGFVKEVFHNFFKEWTVEILFRELEYVRRLFSGSEDVTGRRLHEIAVRMLSKLANRADFQDVQNHIMNFFAEINLDRPVNNNNASIESRKDLPTKNQEAGNGIAGPSRAAGWVKPFYPDKPPHFENPIESLPKLDTNRNDNNLTFNSDLQKNTKKEPVFDELESIVRIKQAEAKMFQTRADDARRESEALKRIAVTKSERSEEEYTSRIAKLRLAEAEEMRKQKVEELQALERAHQDYFSMKMRMETDIKDLLLKMEATRRNLAT